MKKNKLLLLTLFIILFVSSMAVANSFVNNRPTIKNGDQIKMEETTDLSLNVILAEKEYSVQDKLEIKIEIINNSDSERTLEFSSGHKYNIYVKDESGTKIYSWAEDKMFIQAFQYVDISAGETHYFEQEIDLSQFEKGDYILEVELLSVNYEFAEIEKEFKITN
ncbi:BsuPI-related putative proteinase inhibitor [Halanaerobium hydrogeniformans]|uniref:Intracellular proteinase inhibitor n=1 Tax=Halanaerobium hydrogeniformans TaxID=656519 RepID=E4RKZ2_HALHG|nr:BsuPI-related putative proteinase inhibitor [Halanaerobium hydrogeniformans]ADQ15733.1 intracellular proteinase inhibitor [Halanaerobium hydrogeniformans]